MIRQGEVYYATLFNGLRRPVIVVSRDALNRGRYVTIVGCTTQNLDRRRHLPNCVFFRAGEFGLPSDCVAQCESLTQNLVDQLDPAPIGHLDDLALRSVINAVGNAIDADCEPA